MYPAQFGIFEEKIVIINGSLARAAKGTSRNDI
jgi:hypothetical protein